ncbi:hypothetical protein NCS52_00875600 [Fusarium sp. LHS14.1]|nr:hypothetical protein NCS52_00875600 [Fusarium sp. LHS14.1]
MKMEPSGDFDQLCNQLLESQCASWGWQGAYAGQVERNMQLCTEVARLHALAEAQQTRISCLSRENQRLNCLLGHLMPRDVGPPTTYQTLTEEAMNGEAEEENKEHIQEVKKSEIVQKLETLVELSNETSPSETPNTAKSDTV